MNASISAAGSSVGDRSQDADARLDALHHVAIPVKDVAEAVAWYLATFRCRIAYQDDTWALLEFANTHVALVVPDQHPPHVGFLTPAAEAERFGSLTPHRDGTRSIYIQDPAGNSVELLADE